MEKGRTELNLRPIKLLSARERVASALRKAIISRELVEDEQITLDSISHRLGISKTPVREAFQMLENEGLIRLALNRGAVVLGVTPCTVREHFQIRGALESEAAALCCHRGKILGPGAFVEIVRIVEQSEKIIEDHRWEEYGDMNQAFHVAIWTASDNERMKNMLSVMWNGLSIHYMETLDNYAKKSFREHKNLLEHMLRNDVEGARALMRAHIDRSMNDMLTNLEREKSSDTGVRYKEQ
ncbi:MAG: GntR family transcriptional regulator [Synergistaceae bacterium]|jgi:DNA-binding GntR family transcriptional regulator|nr:GntR family transcriptional regulator [Synergistaceae bacterium]